MQEEDFRVFEMSFDNVQVRQMSVAAVLSLEPDLVSVCDNSHHGPP